MRALAQAAQRPRPPNGGTPALSGAMSRISHDRHREQAGPRDHRPGALAAEL